MRSLESGAAVPNVVVAAVSTAGLLDWRLTDASGNAAVHLPTGARLVVDDERLSYGTPVVSTAGTITVLFPDGGQAAVPVGAPIDLDVIVTGLEESVYVSDGCRSVALGMPSGLIEFTPALACISSGGTVTLQARGVAGTSAVSFASAIDVPVSGTIVLTLDASHETLPISLSFPGTVSPGQGSVSLERDGRTFGATQIGDWDVVGNMLQAELTAFGRTDADALHGFVSGGLGDLGFYAEQRQFDTSGFDIVLPTPMFADSVTVPAGATVPSVSWTVAGGTADWSGVVFLYSAQGAIMTSTNVVHGETLGFELPQVPDCLAWKRWDPDGGLLAEVAVRDATFADGLDDLPGFWSALCFLFCAETVDLEARPPEYRIWTSISFPAEE